MSNKPSKPVNLGYGVTRRRPWILFAIACLLTVVLAAFYPQLIGLCKKISIIKLQSQCLDFASSQTDHVFNFTQANVKIPKIQSDGIASTPNIAQRETPAIRYGKLALPWLKLVNSGAPIGNDPLSNSTLFLHGLTKQTGDVRLVHVGIFHPEILKNRKPTFALLLVADVCKTETMGSRLKSLQSQFFLNDADPRDLSEYAFSLIIYPGIPDMEDRSHFTCAYEINGNSGIIDGWLQEDDTVKISVRNGPGFRRNPPILINGMPLEEYLKRK